MIKTNHFGNKEPQSWQSITPFHMICDIEETQYRIQAIHSKAVQEIRARYTELLAQPYTDEDLRNASPCTDCGGECCKQMGCHYSPEDLGEITFESLRTLIDAGKVSIDWYNVETDPDKAMSRQYYLRTRHVDAPVVDPSFGGRCICLTDTGCILSWQERPRGGRYLQARKSENAPCINRYSKETCAQDWVKYEDILIALVDHYGGADDPDLSDLDALNALLNAF